MKNKFKTLLALLLVAVTPLSFASCGTTDIKNIAGDTNSDIKDVISNENNGKESSAPDGNLPTIEENILFEYQGLKMTAKEIINDTIWGTGIKVHVENDSDKDYSIGVDYAIVNNCMMSNLFSCSVASGKKANDTIYLSSADLKAAGINNIGQIELYFRIYDSTTYETIYKTDCITIKTSDYEAMDVTVENTGHTLYDDNGIKIVGKYVDDKMSGKAVVLYIVNNRNENITISCQDMSINGYMVNSIFSSTLYSGKYTIDEITVLQTELDENDISTIENFALKFKVYNSETYQTILTTDELSFDVN